MLGLDISISTYTNVFKWENWRLQISGTWRNPRDALWGFSSVMHCGDLADRSRTRLLFSMSRSRQQYSQTWGSLWCCVFFFMIWPLLSILQITDLFHLLQFHNATGGFQKYPQKYYLRKTIVNVKPWNIQKSMQWTISKKLSCITVFIVAMSSWSCGLSLTRAILFPPVKAHCLSHV